MRPGVSCSLLLPMSESKAGVRLFVLSLFTLPFALPGFGGTLRIVVLLHPGAGQKRTATSRAFFELCLRGYQRAKIGIRSAYQVGRIVS